MRLKGFIAVLLAILMIFSNMFIIAASNELNSAELMFDSNLTVKPGNDFTFEISANFSSAESFDGVSFINIALPQVFTLQKVFYNDEELARGDRFYVDSGNNLKILNDFELEANGHLSWQLYLSVKENAAEGVYVITAADGTEFFDMNGNRLLEKIRCGFVHISLLENFRVGDINSDRNINAIDLIALRKILLGNFSEEFVFFAADTHADNNIDIRDLIALKKLISKTSGTGEIYLSDNADNNGTGTVTSPVKTLKQALALVPDGGTIYILDSLTLPVGSLWSFSKKTITISGGKLDASALKSFQINNNTTFNNIEIILNDGLKMSAGSGKSVSIGEGVTVVGGAKETNPVLLQYTDEFLFSSTPTIYYSEPISQNGVNIVLYDKNGTEVFSRSGMKGTSVKCNVELTNGESYTIKMRYTDAEGIEKPVSNIGENGKKFICIAEKGVDSTAGFDFNESISLETLNKYLSRSVNYSTFSYGNSYNGSATDESLRLILNVGAKYVLRAGGQWYPTREFEQSFGAVKAKLADAHAVDPDIIFESCIFEVSCNEMNSIPIPAWVFEAFGLTPENRNFNAELTKFSDGYGVDYWEKNHHIPDITTLEMQMFVYYRACLYIDAGFEALHLGQVKLTGKNDTNYATYTRLIGMIRDYAESRARRGYVIINAHDNNFRAANGNMLVDMIVAPTRVHAAKGEVNHEVSETNPQRCDIEPGYWDDSVYCSGISGTSPSGWYAEKYPYLVHFDNYGNILGDTSDKDSYVWGRDESAWFAAQPAWYRREFMEFLTNKIDDYDENGHVSYLCRGYGDYYANNPSVLCPNGSGDEETIKRLISAQDNS